MKNITISISLDDSIADILAKIPEDKRQDLSKIYLDGDYQFCNCESYCRCETAYSNLRFVVKK